VTDQDKLNMVADWFDKYDQDRGVSGRNDVQQDLRRIAARLATLEAELAEAKQTLAKLPVTADGVRAYPSMNVYFLSKTYGGGGVASSVLTDIGTDSDGWISDHKLSGSVKVCECYSTREAAEAAAKGAK